MTTIAMETRARAPADAHAFYVWTAVAFVVVAFGGFAPTYWVKLAGGTLHVPPAVHIHGAIFFAWTLYYLAQTMQVARGHVRSHRAWGMAGISLATLMVVTGVMVAIVSMKSADALNMGDRGRQFAIVPLSSVTLFAVLLGLAIVKNARPETHKRLMVLATVPLMQPALARVFRTIIANGAVGPQPVAVSVPAGLTACSMIVVAMIYDWRTRGRPHRVYLIGGPIIAAIMVLRVPLSTTPAWMAIAGFVESLAG